MATNSRPELKLDWCSHEAAKYAVTNWHYSKSLPMLPYVRVGAWEDGMFIGAALFARGANNNMLKPFGLKATEGCELVRVALNQHTTPVSRIIAVAIKLLRKQSPGLRLIVSYADPQEGHHGGIYQAGNWIYSGDSGSNRCYVDKAGKKHHSRAVSENGSGQSRQFGATTKVQSAKGMKRVVTPGKHRYLMPLDDEMRSKIAPLAKPYPKRAGSTASDASAIHAEEGGATPTPALSTTTSGDAVSHYAAEPSEP